MKSIACGVLLTPLAAMANGYLENPQSDSTQSGISIISGWHCTANEIEIKVDGVSIGGTGVGSVRNDTVPICGHNEGGYALLYNYNIPEPGEHVIQVFADGVLLDEREFKTVRSGGVPFLQGASGSVDVKDFPSVNKTTRLQWSQAKQSFDVVEVSSINQSAIIQSLNRSFDGTTYNLGMFGNDSTTYSFSLLDGRFRLERSAFFSGTCIFEGSYTVSGAAVQSNGTYKCSDFSEGVYEAENLFVNSVDLYTGVFYMSPKNNNQIYREIHTGW